MAKKKVAEPRILEAEDRMYELMLVLKPDFLESAVTKKLKEFTKFLKENKCNVTMEDIWGKQNLAYKIKQYDAGIYVVYNLVAPTTFIKDLDSHLRIDNDVIRHLLISIESDYKYSKFEEEVEEPKEEKKTPKKEVKQVKTVKKEEPKEVKKEEVKEEVKEVEKEKAETVVEKKDTKEEVDKGALNNKLDDLLSGDDLNI